MEVCRCGIGSIVFAMQSLHFRSSFANFPSGSAATIEEASRKVIM